MKKTGKHAELKAAILNKLKSYIAPTIILLIIVAAIFVITNYKTEEVEEQTIEINSHEELPEQMVMENDKIKFVMDTATTTFDVTVKDSGKVWHSNPANADEDEIALKLEKDKLKSILMITYSNKGGLDTQFSSYGYSIAKNIYDIEQGDDYIKVKYSIGDVQKEYIIPPVITVANMEALFANLDKKDVYEIQDYYKKYDINKLGKKDNKEELLANYPILETEVIYVLRPGTKDHLKAKFEEIFGRAGYTQEDYERDLALDGLEVVSDKPIFNVNVVYRLEGEDLVVEVPFSEMEYKTEYPLYYITLLPYFGAGSVEDEGFMFVPEGGGALINFNNGKISQNLYDAQVYGWDMAMDRKAKIHEIRTAFPTYGISCGDNSFLCMLEDGATYGTIQADVSGKLNSYNYVNTKYNLVHREQYEVTERATSKMYVYQQSIPNEKITQRYRFINSDSYVDMAKTYQGYLKDKYGDAIAMNDDADAPVVIEVVGAVDKVKQVLGVPVSRPLKLTSYKEAEEIIRKLNESGMTNMSVKLIGWTNGGVKQKMLSKAKTVSELGSKKDLKSLINYANSNGIDVYLDGITEYAKDSSILDGFNIFSDSARLVTREKVELKDYRTVTYIKEKDDEPYYLLTPEKRMEMVDSLVETALDYNANVSFQEVGREVSADYNRKQPFSRQDSLLAQTEKLKELDQTEVKIMINEGNEYAIAYSDIVTNMNLQGSEYTIIDAKVPFYQLAIHGYVNYTGESINLSQNYREELLRSAEYGAGLSFTVMNENAFALQKTLYTEYFGADFALLQSEINDIYTRYNNELGHVFNQEMVNHEFVQDLVTCTTYKDGTKVYVNYDYEDVTVSNGMVVPARDYAVSK